MHISGKQVSSPAKLRTACLVIGISSSGALRTGAAKAIDSAAAGLLARLKKRGDISGDCGKTLLLPSV